MATHDRHDDMADMRLDAAWDAVVRGQQMPSDVDPTIAPTVAAFHARDDAPHPHPRFVADLERQLARKPQAADASAHTEDAMALDARISTAPSRWRRRSGRSWRRWWPLAELPTAALILVLLASAFGAYLLAGGGGSSEDHPTMPAVAGSSSSPESNVPGPEECTVEPRSIESLQAIIASPVARATPGTSGWYGYAPLTGTPTNQDVVTGVTATVHEVFVCLNAGDFRRAFALWTDRFLHDSLEPPGGFEYDPDQSALEASPTPRPPDARLAVVAVRDVHMLEDGRIVATVIIGRTDKPTFAYETHWLFVRVGDRYLVDGIVEKELPEGTPISSFGNWQ